MAVRNVDNQIVLHCGTCGSSFFDKGGIDKISQASARTLTEEAQGQYVLGSQKACPKDKSILLEKVDATLPKNTILLECPSCEGVFAYPDDLLKYKGMKDAKPLGSGAFKLLPAPKSLFMLASFAVLTVAVLLNTGSFSSNTRAASVIQGNVRFDPSTNGSVVMMSFITKNPQTSSVVFYDNKKAESGKYTISSSPSTNHILTIRGFDKSKYQYYKIVFSESEEAVTAISIK